MFPVLEEFFQNLYVNGAQGITSIITCIELTTLPARSGDQQLVRKYRDYLTYSENISLFSLDLNIADYAVRLRADYGFKTPDAIQLGTAMACGADYIVTNDHNWQRLDQNDAAILLVDELAS